MSCSDEFEHYDFSEFTEEELTQFTNNLPQKHKKSPEFSQFSIPKSSLTSFDGGPALNITFESLIDDKSHKIAVNARESHPHIPSSTIRTPYQQFCSWKNGFSVTDLVSPVWCEVQYEYGLYGQRHKPLKTRPSTFTSRQGKEINVQKNIAQQNDKTLKTGASIHKALELQVRPETVPVRITANEERWALRLFNLTAGLHQLILEGRTRELPVFGITHGQVVFGIIDDVTQHFLSAHLNPPKRSVIVSSQSSPVKKKQRRSLSPSQQLLTSTLYSDQSIPELTYGSEKFPLEEQICDTFSAANSPPRHIHPQPMIYDFTLVDYKTRRVPSLPPEEDTISSQLQLMLYHRLLSALLVPETFDFDALWAKQGINPHQPFSRRFVEDIGWQTRNERDLEFHVDLCSMVAAWISVVHLARSSNKQLRGLNPELQIIYQKASVKHSFYNRRTKAKREKKTADNPFEALALQEDLDIARAIEESLCPHGKQAGEASTVNEVVIQNINNTSASQREELALDEVVTRPAQGDPEAVKDSLLVHIPVSRAQSKEHDGTPGANGLSDSREGVAFPYRNGESLDEDTSGLSAILGSRKFLMDDNQLDAYLEDVLQWWFGIRPPRGVELAQSGRCFTCEYRDGCEWREQKAFEATIALEKRKESEV